MKRNQMTHLPHPTRSNPLNQHPHLSRPRRFSVLAFAFLLLSGLLIHPISEAKPKKKKLAKISRITKITQKHVSHVRHVNFIEWEEVKQFIDHMVDKHQFDRVTLQTTLQQAQYIEKAVQLIKPAPPGRKKDWQAYRKTIVDSIRIGAGVQFWNQYEAFLARAETDYGVPAEIIVGILGVETMYGKNTGNFRVIDVITTLAFAYPPAPNRKDRMTFFRNQLAQTLLLARESDIDPYSLLGSYAGAIGLPQFMPGSIRQFAIDFSDDGKIDLRRSAEDAIGSIAFFLQQHGWRRGEPVIFPATILSTAGNHPTNPELDTPPAPWQRFINQGLSAKFSLQELLEAGVSTPSNPPQELLFGLVDLQNGEQANEYWLGANNFFAITQYNRSYFYAMSVLELGSAVRIQRGL